MSASQEILSLRDLVKELLEKFEKYRNSDRKLCCRVWQMQLAANKRNSKELSSYDLFALYCNGNILSSHDSITRAARMIKEDHPHLEGDKKERLKECEKVVEVIHPY